MAYPHPVVTMTKFLDPQNIYYVQMNVWHKFCAGWYYTTHEQWSFETPHWRPYTWLVPARLII